MRSGPSPVRLGLQGVVATGKGPSEGRSAALDPPHKVPVAPTPEFVSVRSQMSPRGPSGTQLRTPTETGHSAAGAEVGGRLRLRALLL